MRARRVPGSGRGTDGCEQEEQRNKTTHHVSKTVNVA
jgi:hypothetical protein